MRKNIIDHIAFGSGVQDVAFRVYNLGEAFAREVVQTMPGNTGVGLGYTRQDGTGHMVVLAKDINGIVKCIDCQQYPPTIVDLPSENGVVSVHVFYKQ